MTPAPPETALRSPRLFRAESVGQSLTFYLPATAASRCLGLIRGVVLAWLISEEEFGLLQIGLLAINILQPLCSIGLNEAVARYVPQYETRNALHPFLKRAVVMIVGVAMVLSGAVYLAADPLGHLLFATLQEPGTPCATGDSAAILTRLAAGTTFALIAYFLLLSILKGLRMFRALSLMELLNSLTFTVVSILAALGGWKTAAAVLACYGLTLAGVVILFATPLLRVIHRATDQSGISDYAGVQPFGRPLVAQMLRFSFWAALAAIMWQTLQYYPMWYLHKMCGQDGEVTAVFGAMRLITQVIIIGAVSIVTVVQTSVTKTWESRGPKAADRRLLVAFKASALLLLLTCLAVAVCRRLIVHLFPAAYADGAPIIPSLLLFFLVGGHLSFLAIHFNLIEKTRYLFIPWVIGVVFNVALGRWMVRPDLSPPEALQAAAWAGVLGITASLIVSLVLIRVARRPLDAGSWILLIAAYALILPVYVLILVVAGVCLLAAATNVIFIADEKQRMREYLTVGRHKIREILNEKSS